MKFSFITLFPDLIKSYFDHGLVSQAVVKSKVSFDVVNPREFALDRHKTVDDTPYGGGDGMILKVEPLKAATLKAKKNLNNAEVIYLSPQGVPWSDHLARSFAINDNDIVFVCGRYGGVDQRFINECVDHEISIGDYVLNGGELAALVLAESILRFTPQFMGNSDSADKDSFSDGLLEGPLFTKPQELENSNVPAVFTSGNHAKIKNVRSALAIVFTAARRPDLLFESKDLTRREQTLGFMLSKIIEAKITIKNELSLEELKVCGWTIDDEEALNELIRSEELRG
jgi:tRNA (guanine37-N1)-methyltransferase